MPYGRAVAAEKPLKYIDVISEHTTSALKEVQKVYGGRVENSQWGVI